MIHTEEDDEFDRIERENNLKGQPYYFDPSNGTISKDKNDPRFTPLGQLWPVSIKREWVNLTSEEIGEIYRVGWAANMELARAIEAKLKEKNT
jgi:hypothetical protein